jgi:hypothetical protein
MTNSRRDLLTAAEHDTLIAAASDFADAMDALEASVAAGTPIAELLAANTERSAR